MNERHGLFRRLLVAPLCLLAGCASTTVDNSVVKDFDANRYLGDWYEIARFDHWFERGMDRTKANYSLRDDGSIRVVNTGVKDGRPRTAVGRAKRTDEPARLRVSFFGPFYSDYRVMALDPDYRHALVGGSGDGYLWILARDPALPAEVREALLAEARRRGYDVSKLLWVRQD